MAFLATRFTPRHRNLGRRRRRVRAEAFAPDLATVPFLADNLEPEPVCVAYWRRIWVAASAAPQQTATCVLRRLNTEICPAKGPVAVGAGALSVIAVRLPGSPLGGVLMAGAVRHVPPAAQFRRALSPLAARSPACSGAAGRPEKLLRRASPSFLRRARVAATGGLAVARLLCSTALLFPAHPLNSPPHRSRSRHPATPATSSRSLSHKEKLPWQTGQRPVAAVARAAPGVAGGCRGGPSEEAMPAGTDSSAAPLPLSPIPVSGRLRAKSIRLQSETKHCGVRTKPPARRTLRVSVGRAFPPPAARSG